jgi:hypothetical protein
MAELEAGRAYIVKARSFNTWRNDNGDYVSVAVYANGEAGRFIGVRTKFGSRFLFTENHYETGAPYGTVQPIRPLERVPEGVLAVETLGVACDHCQQPVEYVETSGEKEQFRGYWRHVVEGPCVEPEPASIRNAALFDWLVAAHERVSAED